jgi:hypothetical protein
MTVREGGAEASFVVRLSFECRQVHSMDWGQMAGSEPAMAD